MLFVRTEHPLRENHICRVGSKTIFEAATSAVHMPEQKPPVGTISEKDKDPSSLTSKTINKSLKHSILADQG